MEGLQATKDDASLFASPSSSLPPSPSKQLSQKMQRVYLHRLEAISTDPAVPESLDLGSNLQARLVGRSSSSMSSDLSFESVEAGRSGSSLGEELKEKKGEMRSAPRLRWLGCENDELDMKSRRSDQTYDNSGEPSDEMEICKRLEKKTRRRKESARVEEKGEKERELTT